MLLFCNGCCTDIDCWHYVLLERKKEKQPIPKVTPVRETFTQVENKKSPQANALYLFGEFTIIDKKEEISLICLVPR